ncbi:MAG: HAMP domain-containing sensor histidine kinase [Chitinophagaceae bacterium]
MIHPLHEDFEDFVEHSLCGYVTADPEGNIIRCNARLAGWLGYTTDHFKGQRFSNLLSIGGKIYYETHLWPLLRMQGFFDEVALELTCKNGDRLQVLLNAYERRDENNTPQFIRLTVFKATDRRQYEQNLQHEKKQAENKLSNERDLSILREQFIAILGHDLRNPLGAIISGTELLSQSSLNETQSRIVNMVKKSGSRMSELIETVMDFARIRLGEGIIINRKDTLLEPVLVHVIEELKASFPSRVIVTEFNITQPVNCDAGRIAQLLSNLLANAITHGLSDTPVYVRAFTGNNTFEISVSNSGVVISPEAIKKIFEPFTRETSRPSHRGLGLGLYIASEIARAHKAQLICTSSPEETRFTFRM